MSKGINLKITNTTGAPVPLQSFIGITNFIDDITECVVGEAEAVYTIKGNGITALRKTLKQMPKGLKWELKIAVPIKRNGNGRG